MRDERGVWSVVEMGRVTLFFQLGLQGSLQDLWYRGVTLHGKGTRARVEGTRLES